ncbi:hypothetical protein [Lysinibacillus antri]|uniref:Uncharacterized protein n=1 Tax=Lysinibacillus antri TaxID=2498145 RepID=A0A432LA70_9BACI|nr:hypothetical protein [Lysinibacillus antri]RUL51114.1 hypothetical protein EK386_12965 [Lysinibacillus antri]
MTTVELLEIEEGYVIEVFTVAITKEIRLKVYDNEDATLILGRSEINFDWTEDAKAIFDSIDTCEPIELLTALSQLKGR